MKNIKYIVTVGIAFIGLIILICNISGRYHKEYMEMSERISSLEQENSNLKEQLGSVTDAVYVYEDEMHSETDAIHAEINQLTTEEETTTEEEVTTEEVTTEQITTEQITTEEVTTEATTEAEVDVEVEEVSTAVYGEGVVMEDIVVGETVPFSNYGTLSETDIYYLQRVAETETYGADMMSKTHVVSVVLNRLQSGTWGSTVQAVVTSPNQFAYSRTSISQTSVDAVNYVLENGDTAQGAMFFHSGGYTATFCGRSCIFGDDVGHYFY